ncbi:hypothetical protein MMC30_004112 [Trapelia coarctata]|nr:hypothetical protein [Trapelia coarctata]
MASDSSYPPSPPSDMGLDLSKISHWELVKLWTDQDAARGDNNTLLDTIESHIPVLSSRCVLSDIPFPDIERGLRQLWYTVIQAGKAFSYDNCKQDTLVMRILYAREMGTLTRTRDVLGTDEKTSAVVRTADGVIWTDLPFLVRDIYEAWQSSMGMSVAQRKNFAAFTARLASVGVGNDALAGCALWIFREALERPRRATASDGGMEVPLAELLPAVWAWLWFAGDKLVILSNRSFDGLGSEISALGDLAKSAGVVSGGFSPQRWIFWRTRLEAMGRWEEEVVAAEAHACYRMMRQRGENTDGPLMEEDDIWALFGYDHGA